MIRLPRLKPGGFVRLEVQDQGRGIAPDDRERVFQKFERAVDAREVAGLGLGLYIVRQIVQMHGGTVAVESTPGEGATFVVTLPSARAPDPTSGGA